MCTLEDCNILDGAFTYMYVKTFIHNVCLMSDIESPFEAISCDCVCVLNVCAIISLFFLVCLVVHGRCRSRSTAKVPCMPMDKN